MADDTGIQWAGDEQRMGATWNPWMGCTKISSPEGTPGSACDFCYAESFAEPKHRARVKADREKNGVEVGGDFSLVPLWGQDGARRKVVSSWDTPLTWDEKARQGGYRMRVFTASLADIFDGHRSILPEWRAHVFDLIERCQQIDWLVLTKRPGSIRHFVPDGWLTNWPRNCWIGTSVEHQGTTNRINQLLAVAGGAPVRFLSCEPLLSEIDLSPFLGADKINWVIAGGETGTGARPTNLDWVRKLRDQCVAANVAFFYKQPGTIAGKDQDVVGIPDIDNPKKMREQWRLDGRAWWQWPGDRQPTERKRGRPFNVAIGRPAPLSTAKRSARYRSKKRQADQTTWENIIARWLDPLPRQEREEVAKWMRDAIRLSLRKP